MAKDGDKPVTREQLRQFVDKIMNYQTMVPHHPPTVESVRQQLHEIIDQETKS